ncbi:prepilin-type N-terminal cleavage/methylation domain-containing protein [Hydrogenophilus thermoluteolus]
MKRKLTLGFSLVELMVAMVLGLLLSGRIGN